MGRHKMHSYWAIWCVLALEDYLHDCWMHFDKMLDCINSKFRLEDVLKLKKASMMRIINKNFGDMSSSSGNTVQISSDMTSLQLFWHEHKTGNGQRHQYFHATIKSIAPIFPTATGEAAWELTIASSFLLSMTHWHEANSSLLEFYPTKKQKSIPLETMDMTTAEEDQARNSEDRYRWWESGDARKLFCTSKKVWIACWCLRSCFE